jgi:hypothetical protein
MRQLKILSMAFMAVLALTGVISAVASAETLPSVLPEGSEKAPLIGTSSTGKSEFGSGALSLSSPKGKGKFEATAGNKGTFNELYEEVRGPLGESCNSGKLGKGLVESTGTFIARDYKNAAKELKVALIFKPAALTIHCEKTEITVEGCVAGALTPEPKKAGEKTKALTITLATSGKDNEIIKVLNEAHTAEENCELKSSTNKGKSELSSQKQTTTLSGFKKGGTATEVEVMPL